MSVKRILHQLTLMGEHLRTLGTGLTSISREDSTYKHDKVKTFLMSTIQLTFEIAVEKENVKPKLLIM